MKGQSELDDLEEIRLHNIIDMHARVFKLRCVELIRDFI